MASDDDLLREVRQLLLDMNVRLLGVEMAVTKLTEDAERRHSFLMDALTATDDDEGFIEDVEVPADVVAMLDQFVSKRSPPK